MVKKKDKQIIYIFLVITLFVVLSLNVFATSYYSTLSIYGGNTLTGASRYYSGSDINIDFDASIGGNGTYNIIECYFNFWGLLWSNEGTKYIWSPSSVSETWSMPANGNYKFKFHNLYTGTWSSSSVHMYSN